MPHRNGNEARLQQLGCRLISRQRCAHNSVDVVAEIQAAVRRAELILPGCSAIAIVRIFCQWLLKMLEGGLTSWVWLLIQEICCQSDASTAAGNRYAGCARSPKLNGFDWVLHLLLSDIELSRDELADMAAGGLLMELLHGLTA